MEIFGIILLSGSIGIGLGFLLCAMTTVGKTADLLDDIERLENELERLTDRDARGRFIRRESGNAI